MTFKQYLNERVNRAIYVRGAQGENVTAKPDPCGWIRYMETERRSDYAQHIDEYNANADRAIELYRTRVSEGISPILAYDCSGLIMDYAMEYNLSGCDYTAAGIYQYKCDPVSGPATITGQLVFKTKSGKPSGITHVGIYVDGDIIESKGRAYGVIRSSYKPSDWQIVGEWPDLIKACSDPRPISEMVIPAETVVLLQQLLNDLDYTDADGKPLAVDGKIGAKTKAAFEKLIRYNIPDLKLIINRTGSIWAAAEIKK